MMSRRRAAYASIPIPTSELRRTWMRRNSAERSQTAAYARARTGSPLVAIGSAAG